MVAMTFQPLAWKCFAVARPRPVEVPVMRMVLFMASPYVSLPPHWWLDYDARRRNSPMALA